jgi:ribosome biogenesis GTPase A
MLTLRCNQPLNSDNNCMSETKKPVGLRLTSKVWESLKQYGLEHKPSGQALGISTDTPPPLSNVMSDDRLTEMIKQQLNDLLSPMLYDFMSDSQSDVSKLLNIRITDIVDTKIGEVTTELEAYTQQQCEAVRVELKKSRAIG